MSGIYHLYPADIGAVRGKGLLRVLSEAMVTPATDRIHFFVIKEYLPWDDDYEILESIGKGIAIGRLSFYNMDEVEIYRLKLGGIPVGVDGKTLRRQAVAELSKLGRARYDWMLIAQMMLSIPQLLVSHGLPPWKPEFFPYGKNKDYICTEAARVVTNFIRTGVGLKPLIPDTVVPLPAGFKKALDEKKMERVWP